MDEKKLPKEQAKTFLHTVVQLLFESRRRRRDQQTAVAFSTTRVEVPDEHDWETLKWVLKYLNET